MKLTINRQSLLSACQMLSQATGSGKHMKPILANIKMDVGDDPNQITLTATDLEVGMRCDLKASDVENPGPAILPVARIVSILRESEDENIAIDADARRCIVSTFTDEFEMPSEDPSGFPDVATMGEREYFQVEAEALDLMIRRTQMATGDADGRYATSGILLTRVGNKMEMVATDTRRLALADYTVAGEYDDVADVSALIPYKASVVLVRMLAQGDVVKVSVSKNDIIFQTQSGTMVSRLLEGAYPPYKKIIPEISLAKFSMPASDLASAVRKSAILADHEMSNVWFSFGEGRLVLKSQGAGKSVVDTKIDYAGEVIEVGMDPKRVLDFLKAFDKTESIEISLISNKKPIAFRVGDNYLHLIFPQNPPK